MRTIPELILLIITIPPSTGLRAELLSTTKPLANKTYALVPLIILLIAPTVVILVRPLFAMLMVVPLLRHQRESSVAVVHMTTCTIASPIKIGL